MLDKFVVLTRKGGAKEAFNVDVIERFHESGNFVLLRLKDYDNAICIEKNFEDVLEKLNRGEQFNTLYEVARRDLGSLMAGLG